jgi:hypothetical protein
MPRFLECPIHGAPGRAFLVVDADFPLPEGWSRLIVERRETRRRKTSDYTRHYDKYYVAPNGKRLQSTKDVRRFLGRAADSSHDVSDFPFSREAFGEGFLDSGMPLEKISRAQDANARRLAAGEPPFEVRVVAPLYDAPRRFPDATPDMIAERDSCGRTALHYLTGDLTDETGRFYDGDLRDAVRWLLARGADPDARDDAGKTALHYLADRSIWRDDREAVFRAAVEILRGGGDPNVKDAYGLTPAARAAVVAPAFLERLLREVTVGARIDLDAVCEGDPPTVEREGTNEPLLDAEWRGVRTKGRTVRDLLKESTRA